MSDDENEISVTRAAKLSGKSAKTLRRMIRLGKLQPVRVSPGAVQDRVFLSREDVVRLVGRVRKVGSSTWNNLPE